jgi:hypothetical protein
MGFDGGMRMGFDRGMGWMGCCLLTGEQKIRYEGGNCQCCFLNFHDAFAESYDLRSRKETVYAAA